MPADYEAEKEAWIERQLDGAPPVSDAQIERTAAMLRNVDERERQAQAPKDAGASRPE